MAYQSSSHALIKNLSEHFRNLCASSNLSCKITYLLKAAGHDENVLRSVATTAIYLSKKILPIFHNLKKSNLPTLQHISTIIRPCCVTEPPAERGEKLYKSRRLSDILYHSLGQFFCLLLSLMPKPALSENFPHVNNPELSSRLP